MIEEELFPQPVDVDGLGTLRPLTFPQLATMSGYIRDHLLENATHGLSSDQQTVAHAAVANQLSDMTFWRQCSTVLNSYPLIGSAVALMAGQQWGSTQALSKIQRKEFPKVIKAIMGSYGYRWKAADEPSEDSDEKKVLDGTNLPSG